MRKIIIALIFVIFIILRLGALYNVSAFEDHDSIQYLTMIRNIVEGDFQTLFSYNPDKTFIFPFLGSLTYPLTQSVEISARLVSFLSSIVLFFCLFALSNRLTNKNVTLVVMFFFSVHPLLVSHSIGILTEPLYISIIYSKYFLQLNLFF